MCFHRYDVTCTILYQTCSCGMYDVHVSIILLANLNHFHFIARKDMQKLMDRGMTNVSCHLILKEIGRFFIIKDMIK